MSLARRWIAVALLLAWPAAGWAQEYALDRSRGPVPGTSSWLADSLRWGGITMPPALGDCPDEPYGPHRLPPRPAGNWLGLVFADGRQSGWDSLSAVGGTLYWPLERACHALGLPLTWDPTLLRGELQVADTLRCAFIVGGEFLHCGGLALQMQAPVLYLGDRVLLPIDFLDLITRHVIGDRFRHIEDARLLVQLPAPGPVAAMSSEQVGNRTYFAWKLPDPRTASFSTDGIATITVHVPGVRLDPLLPPRPEPRAGGCLWAVRPGADGLDYVLRVDPAVQAWLTQSREQGGELRLALSANAADRSRDGYAAWDPPRAGPVGRREGPVLLVLPDPREGGFSGAPGVIEELLREVAGRLQEHLEAGGVEVVVVEAAGRSEGLRGAGARRPSACLCLLPNLSGHALLPGCRLVTAEPLPGERPQLAPKDRPAPPAGTEGRRGGTAAAPALRRWDEVAAAHSGNTHRLAWLVGLYLQTEFPRGRFAREHWPAAFFDGLDAPAVAVYLGEIAGLSEGEPAVADSLYAPVPLPERLAAAIAGAILMFTMGAWSE